MKLIEWIILKTPSGCSFSSLRSWWNSSGIFSTATRLLLFSFGLVLIRISANHTCSTDLWPFRLCWTVCLSQCGMIYLLVYWCCLRVQEAVSKICQAAVKDTRVDVIHPWTVWLLLWAEEEMVVLNWTSCSEQPQWVNTLVLLFSSSVPWSRPVQRYSFRKVSNCLKQCDQNI